MLFSSIHFLFLFLPITLFLYFIIPSNRWRNLLLLAASLIFYAWGEPVAVLLLVISILLNWWLGLLIESFQGKGKPGWAKAWMLVAVLINLSALVFFKYAGFIVKNLAALFRLPLETPSNLLPVGISFFTFSAISYIMDIYRQGAPAQRNPLHTGNYIAMFPKLMQGPIARYEPMLEQLSQRTVRLTDVAAGSRRFIIGLAKKVLIADALAVVANKVFAVNPALLGALTAWYGLIAFALQIYFDFSAYTDMAIGLGRILGFQLPENFNYPYTSRSISDFWRRWHISLTGWFRTYVFLPLEFARKREKHFRQPSNLLIVLFLTGLWHGASWNFILWGVYFGVILAIEAGGWGKQLKKAPPALQHLYAILLILFGWVFFRIENISGWGRFFAALFGAQGLTGLVTARSLNVLLYWPLMLAAMLLCWPVFQRVSAGPEAKPSGALSLLTDVALLALLALSIVALVSSGYHAFLYFRF